LEWALDKPYQTIICTRCAYFSRDPLSFVKRCHNNLGPEGVLYVDWGLGDHWRFKDFKVGWIKNEEHEYAYGEGNRLWSAMWNNDFLKNDSVKSFSEEIKCLGYDDIEKAIRSEVPFVLDPADLDDLFAWDVQFLFLRKPYVQLYLLLRGIKK